MASFQTRRRQLSSLMWPPAGAGKIKRAPSSGRASERRAANAALPSETRLSWLHFIQNGRFACFHQRFGLSG